ncbi:MAG: hypothetical protein CR982_06160 [Candidatus Cloacimonadota bacterium]|nr:MAG: hypothetical protein CR982_06160 [Candidatus Cloacimonadota bacterium]PIE78104.1 MAG: hypothetical protein CSA15_09720 [Candidatus Delongbacteria bacterium]
MKIFYLDLDPLKFNSRAKKILISSNNRGIDTQFIGCSKDKFKFDNGIKVKEFSFYANFPLKLRIIFFWITTTLFMIKEILKEGKPKYIYSNDIYPMLPAYTIKLIFNIDIIYDSHEYWRGHSALKKDSLSYKFWIGYESFLIKKFDEVITVGKEIAKLLKSDHSLKKLPHIIPNIPDTKIKDLRSDYIRERYSLSRDTFIFIYQGSLYKGDSFDKIIGAVENIENCALVVVSHKMERIDEYKRKYKHILEKKIFFHEGVDLDSLAKITSSANCGLTIFENLGESFYYSVPNKMFEYLASSIPQVVSNFPEIERYVVKNGIGVSVDPHNEKEIFTTLLKISTDKGFYNRLKERSFDMRDSFKWENYFDKVFDNF